MGSISSPMRSNLVQAMATLPEELGRESASAWTPGTLDAIFHPLTVAVIGATEKPASVGRTVLRNLLEQPFGATIFPINPNRPNVLGIRCYPNISSIGEPVDLAIVVTPAATVPEVLQECVAAGVRGAIVISAGFAELGAGGRALEN